MPNSDVVKESTTILNTKDINVGLNVEEVSDPSSLWFLRCMNVLGKSRSEIFAYAPSLHCHGLESLVQF